ncbi:lipoteichoic acid synthase [Enterococcus sp. PF1-24]|uniref:LTA synthase family protein n=1 Tax=unclassified Enterococcus TaxID=2608891 RepID=UPI002475792B|nr:MULTISPECIES: LTA synthase family protein [unclassified Enterococcus]MDH6365470.1 lipoteichoic acid synthase [Enterococcus sp. PFB1-1]MDH6402576.1 lipoteichoic acid synthase [Enterococcus sp. PF1-24]
MKQKLNAIFPITRQKLVLLLALLLWTKSLFAYLVDFRIGYDWFFQYAILLVNPLASILLVLGLTLLIKRKGLFIATNLILYFSLSLLIIANVLYFREYTDFITINTVFGFGKVASGLGATVFKLLKPYDVFYLLDLIVLGYIAYKKQFTLEYVPKERKNARKLLAAAFTMFVLNLGVSELFRPGLLTRTFSREYIVKYLGLNTYAVLDGIETYQTNQVRAEASPTDLSEVTNYVADNYTAPNPELFGIAKGKNVIVIHLESFQQFLIDFELTDENGQQHEVTPFLNQLYHSDETYGFENFFHQVNAGRTSDAETLMENSLFGLKEGALFTKLGSENTFQAAPNILGQTQGYTSAVFHGNAGSFWNRNETYKRFGYDYFFDASSYEITEENSFQYGLMDKPFFEQSVNYLEHLQQPFYAKFLSVSNHHPYDNLKGEDLGFPLANASDQTINSYFATANYLDSAIAEFFDYLKATGLYENSLIVLYGDHYGISNSRNDVLAELLGAEAGTWDDFDNMQMQRVPFMLHLPGNHQGGISQTYAGEVDALPTILHLLGVDTSQYFQLGQDLFSANRQEVVAFRNGNFVTPNYSVMTEAIYDNATGELISEPSEELMQEIENYRKLAEEQLSISDAINNGDLLRFYNDSGLLPINPNNYNYLDQLTRLTDMEKQLGTDSTSLYSQNNDSSSSNQFVTSGYLK